MCIYHGYYGFLYIQKIYSQFRAIISLHAFFLALRHVSSSIDLKLQALYLFLKMSARTHACTRTLSALLQFALLQFITFILKMLFFFLFLCNIKIERYGSVHKKKFNLIRCFSPIMECAKIIDVWNTFTHQFSNVLTLILIDVVKVIILSNRF